MCIVALLCLFVQWMTNHMKKHRKIKGSLVPTSPNPPKKEKKARKQGNLRRKQTRAWASSFKWKEVSDEKVQNTKSLQPGSSNLLTWLTGTPDIAKQLQMRKTDKTEPNHQDTERKDLKRKPLDRYTTREWEPELRENRNFKQTRELSIAAGET